VWSKALKVRGVSRHHSSRRGSVGAESRFSRHVAGSRVMRRTSQHQEGNGAGDGERLHERSNALKGEPQERIWHETRPAGSGRIKASRGRENLKAQVVGCGKPGPRKAAAPGGENAVGEGTSWEEPFSGCSASPFAEAFDLGRSPGLRRARVHALGPRTGRRGAGLWLVRKHRASARSERPGRSLAEASGLGSRNKLSVWAEQDGDGRSVTGVL
jgi:hypothetical protein